MTRLHLIGFPHTAMNSIFPTCAHTQKTVRFVRMGWDDLVVYANEGSEVGNAELVEIFSTLERESIFDEDPKRDILTWPKDDKWKLFNARVSAELKKRVEKEDILLMFGGLSQSSVALEVPEILNCEPGVGYSSIYSQRAAFESYAWQHFIYGKYQMDGRYYDTVIPLSVDPDDFPYLNDRGGEEFLLFVGRMSPDKGLHTAVAIANAANMRLVVAGAGVLSYKDGEQLTTHYQTVHGNIYYAGVLDADRRANFMAQAHALIVSTDYVEPFGAVATEAMMCGTPVIAIDWGSFTEIVDEGLTGYRFRSLKGALEAIEKVRGLNPQMIRATAMKRFSIKSVKPLYENWFETLNTLHGEGWYSIP